MREPIMPGATLGVLGGGQLGRMFTIAAKRLGYRVHVFSPEEDAPTAQVADCHTHAAFDDLDAVANFARGLDAVTLEFENLPLETTSVVDKFAPLRPSGQVLHTTQHRLREKRFLRSIGVPVAPFRPIRSLDDVSTTSPNALPGVLKTASWGYDGKGQVRVQSSEELRSAWQAIDTDEAVLEAFIDFEAELSVVAVRSHGGAVETYGPIANTHSNHILDLSFAPGGFPPEVEKQAAEIARAVLSALDVEGVMCIEFFLQKNGNLLVNELAPRPHNSGHLTIDAHQTCQFEQQVRAVCGLPLGSANQLRPAAMVNLLGDLLQPTPPDWQRVLKAPSLKLHLYGKQEARVGRKMGHLTALADSSDKATEAALAARQELASVSLGRRQERMTTGDDSECVKRSHHQQKSCPHQEASHLPRRANDGVAI